MSIKDGVNGESVLTEHGVGDRRVTLFTMLTRGLEPHYIAEQIRLLVEEKEEKQEQKQEEKQDLLRDLFVMAFQTRDIRGGKGERDLFHTMFRELYRIAPEITVQMIPFIPEYGCWRDLWKCIEEIPELESHVLDHVRRVAQEDGRKMLQWEILDEGASNPSVLSLSLLGKWLPREKSGRWPGLARRIANRLYGDDLSKRRRMIKYRHFVSKLNRHLKTVEVNMCSHTWSAIDPERVPGRCLSLHRRAFLNQKGNEQWVEEAEEELLRHPRDTATSSPTLLRYPEDPDRMACRENFLKFAEDLKAGTKTARGAHVVYPHELVDTFWNSSEWEEAEKEILEGQWRSLREEVVKGGGLGRCIPMCDFSGSMEGIPKLISLALGILISEVNAPAFRDRILTFDSQPAWHSFSGMESLKEKVESCKGTIGQGYSTDFFKACMCVLNQLKEERVPVGEEPEDLIVLTDMGFDAAAVDHSHIRHLVRVSHQTDESIVRSQDPWISQLERIRQRFQEEGELLWGEGKGWKPPRIVVWNLRAEYKDFHATAEQEGVVQLSGWSPSLLRILSTKGVKVGTPYDSMRAVLDDPRYDPIRACVDSF